MEKVFLKEFNCFGYKKDCLYTLSNANVLVKAWSIETLKLLLETQIKKENFEAADFIQKEIDSRKNEKNIL